MHDYEKITKPEEREVDAREMLVTQALPPRINGPALWLLVNPDGPARYEPTVCVGPSRGYNKVVLQFDWKMVDPAAKARVDLWQTLDPDYLMPQEGDPLAGLTPLLLDARDKDHSTWIVDPGTATAENRVRLTFPKLAASHIAFRWTTIPRNAPATARAWVLLAYERPAAAARCESYVQQEMETCEVCGSPNGKHHNPGVIDQPAFFACCHSPWADHPHGPPCCTYLDEAFRDLLHGEWHEVVQLARRRREDAVAAWKKEQGE